MRRFVRFHSAQSPATHPSSVRGRSIALSRPDPVRVVPQKKQGLFGLFGRTKAKPDLRQEPAPTPVAQPRATSQVIARIQPEPARPASVPADDLFPEHKKDEQFEIPAFLRRQTN